MNQADRDPPDGQGRRLMRRLERLASCSDAPDGLTRLAFSPSHRAASALVAEWMRRDGLSVRLDAAGTLVGRRDGPAPGCPVLLVGSHLDTVRDAGRFDGALGVLAGLEALALLREGGIALPFAVELLGFGDEEGVRFPVTLTGSRALAGVLDAPAQVAARDAGGVSLGEALRMFGGDPDRLDGARFVGRALGFLELHIEQGPVLERAGLPLGVVSAINGASRFRLAVEGEAGHAGTVPMAERRDALAATAEMMVAIRRIALDTGRDVTATVGRIEARPGAVNVIPGAVEFTLDLRAPQDATRASAWAAMAGALAAIADRHRVVLRIARTHDAAAIACDPVLQDRLERACAALGVAAIRLPSGAGHDAMAMAALCPMAMLFVRCRGGISHNPAEFVEAADAALAVRALARMLADWEPVGGV